MKVKIKDSTATSIIISSTFFMLLLLGGLGVDRSQVSGLCIIYSALLSLYAYIKNKRLSVPRDFLLYLLFLGVLIIHSIFKNGRTDLVLLFVSGGSLWLAVHNNRSIFDKTIPKIIIGLGLVFFTLWLWATYGGFGPTGDISLYYPVTKETLHSQLGDYWAIALIVIFYLYLQRAKIWHFIIALVGAVLLFYSYSRSSYFSLVFGVIFILYKKGIFEKYKKQIFLLLFLAALLFINAGKSKSILFSRPYFLQAVIGFTEHPLGVGIGRFAEISHETETKYNFLGGQSIYTHNIILEVIVGLGFFSLPFIWFLVRRIRDVFCDNKNALLYSSVFVGLLINFLFNYSYVIPSMFWLFMISLV